MDKGDSITNQFTTEYFIANLIATLQDDDNMDAALLNILSENIVKMSPTETAVDDAAKAIESIAAKRAEEIDNELAHQD